MLSLRHAFRSTHDFMLVPVAVLALLSAGCGSPYMPPGQASIPQRDPSAGAYPQRSDFLVVGKTGLDGAPKRWPTKGFPPLKSAQFPNATPDTEIAEEIRKQLSKNVLDPGKDLSATQTQDLAGLLEGAFGTPARPRVGLPRFQDVLAPAEFKKLGTAITHFGFAPQPNRLIDLLSASGVLLELAAASAAQAELKLDDDSLARGGVLYRRWCLQCHGPTGAGDGAHAIELAAMPRDYRQGIFKFTTAFAKPGQPKKGLGSSGKPRREDLQRTVRHGLDGSMMPAFPTLSDGELEDLISYVIHLSIRGETEFSTIAKAAMPTEDDPEFVGPELAALFDKNRMYVLYNWGVAARSKISVPEPFTPTAQDRLESAFKGYKYYNSAEFGCAACHVNYGREPALKWDLWGGVVQPRNLMLGVYRGGRTGKDLYARIYGGIHPSGMTAFQNTLATGPSYPDRPNKIWNVVHFLQALADPTTRQQLRDPVTLARVKARLRQQGDTFLDDLNGVQLEP